MQAWVTWKNSYTMIICYWFYASWTPDGHVSVMQLHPKCMRWTLRLCCHIWECIKNIANSIMYRFCKSKQSEECCLSWGRSWDPACTTMADLIHPPWTRIDPWAILSWPRNTPSLFLSLSPPIPRTSTNLPTSFTTFITCSCWLGASIRDKDCTVRVDFCWGIQQKNNMKKEFRITSSDFCLQYLFIKMFLNAQLH